MCVIPLQVCFIIILYHQTLKVVEDVSAEELTLFHGEETRMVFFLKKNLFS